LVRWVGFADAEPARVLGLGDHSQSVRSAFVTLALSLFAVAAYAQKTAAGGLRPAQQITELRQQLEKILQDSHTPGLSVAIVRRGGPEWVAGLGESNVAADQAATNETLFRIGSISKAFVSLSILNLVNEGKVLLQDPVHKLVPDVSFENRWEATDPVRVVDLLEHTTGWDDIHLKEPVKDAKGKRDDTARRARL
jgi:CubicO group peptidase (beta-lactamase class C family)